MQPRAKPRLATTPSELLLRARVVCIGSGERTCVTCHTAENEGPRYAIAGTLFPTGHEPDDCNGISGAASGAKVVITDANGTDHELAPNDVGNFFFNGSIPKPYTAKVVSDAGERLMVTPQQDGDCNKCHTAAGAGGAPGRVVVPF
jgi:hypothetical protein